MSSFKLMEESAFEKLDDPNSQLTRVGCRLVKDNQILIDLAEGEYTSVYSEGTSESCQDASYTLTCTNGELQPLNRDVYLACVPNSCNFFGEKVPVGSERTFYSNNSSSDCNQLRRARTCLPTGEFSGDTNYMYSACVPLNIDTNKSCNFNSYIVADGQTTSYYKKTVVIAPDEDCQTLAVTCNNKQLSYSINGLTADTLASYNKTSCEKNCRQVGNTSVIIPNTGSSVTLYSSPNATASQTCAQLSGQQRCNNGAIENGQYIHAGCTAFGGSGVTNKNCSKDGIEVPHNNGHTFYQNPSVIFPNTCVGSLRTCQNGEFIGGASNFNSATCKIDCRDTNDSDALIPNGQQTRFYYSITTGTEAQCEASKQKRRCTDTGLDSPAYVYKSCGPPQVTKCRLPTGEEIENGQVKELFAQSRVIAPDNNCQSATFRCSEGTLVPVSGQAISGYSFSSCQKDCRLNSSTVIENGRYSVQMFSTDQVAPTDNCDNYQGYRTCRDGVLDRSDLRFTGCTKASPQNQSCTLDGKTVQHNSGDTFYTSSSVTSPNTCAGASRTCNNGVLGAPGNYTSANCVVNCLDPNDSNRVIAHNSSTRAYFSKNSGSSSDCAENQKRTRLCTNGVLDNPSYVHATCTTAPPQAQSCTLPAGGGELASGNTSGSYYYKNSTGMAQSGEGSCSQSSKLSCTNGTLSPAGYVYTSCAPFIPTLQNPQEIFKADTSEHAVSGKFICDRRYATGGCSALWKFKKSGGVIVEAYTIDCGANINANTFGNSNDTQIIADCSNINSKPVQLVGRNAIGSAPYTRLDSGNAICNSRGFNCRTAYEMGTTGTSFNYRSCTYTGYNDSYNYFVCEAR